MANEVYANNMEISCKAASGKSIAAFPDVCFTPPQAPPTPLGVPIPYPNTGLSKDTTKGTRTIRISRKEVMLKNKSYYKTSYGDEPGRAPKKGIVTSKIKGKVYFTSWSMNVKFESKNVVRHMDLMTHNHGSQPGNTMTWTYADRMAYAKGLSQCDDERTRAKDACGDTSKKVVCPDISALKKASAARAAAKKKAGDKFKDNADYQSRHQEVQREFSALAEKINNDPCQKALRCFLAPYRPNRCCPGQTGDHLVDAASFGPRKGKKITGWSKYQTNKAPCICAEGPNQTTATHGQLHTRRGVVALHEQDDKGEWPRGRATQVGAKAARKTFPDSNCSQECLEAQLNKYHDTAKDDGAEKPIKANASMTSDVGERAAARAEMFEQVTLR